MEFKRSKADPCLYFAWTTYGLILWMSWVDDLLACGKKDGVMIAKSKMLKHFECDEVGEVNEYVGCKIDYNKTEQSMKLTQPVLLQSFEDEFELTKRDYPKTPAIPGEVLKPGEDVLDPEEQSRYRSGVGKLLYAMKWSRPDILNATRELSRHMMTATGAHMAAMYRVMQYCLGTPD